MTASINLYDTRWLARRQTQLPWPPLAVLGAAGMAAIAVIAYNHWAQAGLQARLAVATTEKARMTHADTPGGDRSAALAALADAAQRRENSLRQWRGLDAAVLGHGGGSGPTNNPSPNPSPNVNADANANASTAANSASASNVSIWFTTLSAVVQDGVWLTRVQADVSGGFRFEGRAQDGVALSAYLERWRSQTLLAGVALQTLEMRRAGADGASAAGAGAEPVSGPSTSPSDSELVFVLSNLAPGKSPDAGEAAATRPLSRPATTTAPGSRPSSDAAGGAGAGSQPGADAATRSAPAP